MAEPPRGGSSRATSGPGDDGPGKEVRIGATSGYGARTRLPYVDVTFEEAGRPELREGPDPEDPGSGYARLHRPEVDVDLGREKTEADVAWAAGFFDGEGTVTLRKRKLHAGASDEQRELQRSLWLQAYQNVVEPLARLYWLFGGRVYREGATPSRATRRLAYVWHATAGEAVPALEAMLPFLVVKREAAEWALRYQRLLTGDGRFGAGHKRWVDLTREEIDERRACWEAIHGLNQGLAAEESTAVRCQISPEEARRVGLILLECAEAAEQDANFVRFMTGTVGLELGQVAQVLREFRGLRDQRSRRERDDA